MLTSQNLLRMVIELIFVLLGGLIVWLGLAGKIFFVAQPVPWMIVSIALILWGLRALYTRGRWWTRWENWTRGLSLTLLGVVMLVIYHAPFHWVGYLIAISGILLVTRGLIGGFLVLRPR
jgi:hypothetical protein